MRKTIYILLAIALAVGLTFVQAVIAKRASVSNETKIFIAADGYRKGTVIEEGHIEEVAIHSKNGGISPSVSDREELLGKILSYDIGKGDIYVYDSVYDSQLIKEDERYISLKVDGGNFNAGCLYAGDTVDIYFLPDFEKLENYQIVWLNEMLMGYSRFIKGKSPGILISDLRINHISKTAGEQAEYVSICVPRPVEEVISFLEQISEYEFIGR